MSHVDLGVGECPVLILKNGNVTCLCRIFCRTSTVKLKKWHLKGTNTQHCGHMGQKLMVEIYSKGPVRAIGKVFIMKRARTPIKTHKGDAKCKQTAVLVVRINNIILTITKLF